jgi:hypothetical protein
MSMIKTIRYLWPEGSLHERGEVKYVNAPCPMCNPGEFTGKDRLTFYMDDDLAYCRSCGAHKIDDAILAGIKARYNPDNL